MIGGWGCGTVVRQHPNREIDFDCACVACVRACVRSCASGVFPQWLGSAGRICGGGEGVQATFWNFKVNLFSCKSVCYASKTLAKRLSRSPRLGGLMLPEISCFSEDLGLAPPGASGHAAARSTQGMQGACTYPRVVVWSQVYLKTPL